MRTIRAIRQSAAQNTGTQRRNLPVSSLWTLALVLGCASSSTDDAGSELTSTSSATGSTSMSTAPSSTPINPATPEPLAPAGSSSDTNGPATTDTTPPGGPSSTPANTGSASPPATSEGTVTPPSGTGGTTPGVGGSNTEPEATGGSEGSTESSGAGGSVAGSANAGAPNGGAASSGGAAGGSNAEPEPDPGPFVPPVRDTDSEVPISNAGGGYTVEGNYAYGPLTAQRLDVIYPNGEGPDATELRPMVLMFHGGGWIHSYTNNYGSGKDHMSTFFNRFLAHGYIVCNAEYRVADDTPDGALAPGAVEDALLAAQWCWDNMDYFHGDRSRFVVTGASAGGHLALMVGMATADANLGPTHPTAFNIAAIVDGYGIADVESLLTKGGFTAQWIPASLPDRDAVARAVNPMTYVRADIPPLIVVQGSEDNTAPVADSRRLVELLVAAGADATMHEVPGAGHGYASPASAWPDAEQAMFDWLSAQGISE